MILVPQDKIDACTARGWWGTQTLWDLFQRNLAAHPEHEAVVDAPNRQLHMEGAPRRLTYAQLADEALRMASVLSGAGLAKDDVIAVQLPNGVEQFAVYLACARLGIIVTPVPVQYREHELAYILNHVSARAIVTVTQIGKHAHADMALALRQQTPSLAHVFAYGSSPPTGARALERLLREPADAARVEQATQVAAVTANDVFTICWTSGTEARPKGVPRSHNEWLIIAPSIIEAAGLAPGSRLLNPFPFVNMAGLSTNFAAWLQLGGTVVQHHPFDLSVFLQQLREERIDYTVAPPAVLNMLLQNPPLLEGIDFQRLRSIGSGSAPLSDWMVETFHRRFGVQIVNYFGSNEGAALSGNATDIPDPTQRAAFFPRAGVKRFTWSVSTAQKIESRLVDPASGEIIEQGGVPGELRFRGPTIFSRYWNAPELTRGAFDADGFYKTGDLFEIAGENQQFYRYVGRSKDVVIRGGMNISPEELEGLIVGHPKVREVAVVGYPDGLLGERLCACVVARADTAPTLPELVDYLREQHRIATFKLPERLLVLDALPRNPVGKIVKHALRDLLASKEAA
ncbi:short-chain-fatty-acid--CoA ligase FadK [Cupriavidus basilensis OR16]|uniref:Short-chain-fatty-acid--CoA ligase FadK n=1 Tax=Cupriavidus basilensis OR16 TaxID=1127483 RepID=H1S2Y8_9BURK|nr:class I adenylate-forming enzyme family protein [Cupriavidus basilensis]EHP43203.1 short-chain-fatty-acid--CoA ligase FadK [Cupriavidus basilensis OR16]